ncbi:MAG: HepT-like ribonuclease domain-containing protein [Bacteroidota bacterium]
MRDKLIHGYMGVDISVIWKTCQEDIPQLERLINNTFLPKT